MILLIVAIVTRPVSQIEQEVLTLVEHYNSPVVFCRVPVARKRANNDITQKTKERATGTLQKTTGEL
jgi:hypothetical protein